MEKLKLFRPVAYKWPISSPFGRERDLIIDGVRTKRVHNGIDFACPVGTTIMAVADGTVIRAGFENDRNEKQGYGLRIMQEIELEGKAYYVWYAHCSRLFVVEGSHVTKGLKIAETGNTGRTTGAHLHLGVRRANTNQFCDVEFPPEIPLDVA